MADVKIEETLTNGEMPSWLTEDQELGQNAQALETALDKDTIEEFAKRLDFYTHTYKTRLKAATENPLEDGEDQSERLMRLSSLVTVYEYIVGYVRKAKDMDAATVAYINSMLTKAHKNLSQKTFS